MASNSPESAPMSYACMKAVFGNLSFGHRANLAKRVPELRTLNKKMPFRFHRFEVRGDGYVIAEFKTQTDSVAVHWIFTPYSLEVDILSATGRFERKFVLDRVEGLANAKQLLTYLLNREGTFIRNLIIAMGIRTEDALSVLNTQINVQNVSLDCGFWTPTEPFNLLKLCDSASTRTLHINTLTDEVLRGPLVQFFKRINIHFMREEGYPYLSQLGAHEVFIDSLDQYEVPMLWDAINTISSQKKPVGFEVMLQVENRCAHIFDKLVIRADTRKWTKTYRTSDMRPLWNSSCPCITFKLDEHSELNLSFLIVPCRDWKNIICLNVDPAGTAIKSNADENRMGYNEINAILPYLSIEKRTELMRSADLSSKVTAPFNFQLITIDKTNGFSVEVDGLQPQEPLVFWNMFQNTYGNKTHTMKFIGEPGILDLDIHLHFVVLRLVGNTPWDSETLHLLHTETLRKISVSNEIIIKKYQLFKFDERVEFVVEQEM